jgi:hypothetical protein
MRQFLPSAVVPVHTTLYLDAVYPLQLKSVLRQTTNRTYIYVASSFSAYYSEHNHNVLYLYGAHWRKSIGRSVFARSNAWIVCSNPTRGMDVCVRLFYVCVVLCVGSGLATG